MQLTMSIGRYAMLCCGVLSCALLPSAATAATCKTQAQLTPTERSGLVSTARTLVSEVQSGDVNALRTNTLPAVAADFTGIASAVDGLKPLVGGATITVDTLYDLDSTTEAAGSSFARFATTAIR